MTKLFYSYRDGQVYMLHKYCPLELLMDEQISGGDGLLIYANEVAFEIVEYMNGKETGYTTKVHPIMRFIWFRINGRMLTKVEEK